MIKKIIVYNYYVLENGGKRINYNYSLNWNLGIR